MSKAAPISAPCRRRSVARGGKRFAREAIFYAFDLLYLDGRDLDTRAAVGAPAAS